MWRIRIALAGAILPLAQAAHAGPPALSLPIDCDLGETCYIEDYVDTDPGPGQRDFTCGLKSRDGHRGTDIGLFSFDAMERGVNVLAAAPGRVAAIRDEMPDRPATRETRTDIRGRECGNAVRIDHGDGWQTLYCHMRQGSITVRPGDAVGAGDVLGQVGLSGQTNFPHVHLGVLKDSRIVDPFNPIPGAACGAAQGRGLWSDAPAYHRAGLATAGFSTSVPDFVAVRSGAARVRMAHPGQPLVFYAHVFYPQDGDTLRLTATGPQGEVFGTVIPLDAPEKQLFRAYGRKAPSGGWPVGEYRGHVRLERAGRVIAVRHADITVTP